MKYAKYEDIEIAIEILKHISNKNFNEEYNKKIRPPINRVIMELEDLCKSL
jgi:hypothetical protein